MALHRTAFSSLRYAKAAVYAGVMFYLELGERDDFSKSQFEKKVTSKKVKLAALPQSDEKWCLATKVDGSTAYLGDANGTEAVKFASLDDLIRYSQEIGMDEVLVITGTNPWDF